MIPLLQKTFYFLILFVAICFQAESQSLIKKDLIGRWWATQEIILRDDTLYSKTFELKPFTNWKYATKKYSKASGFYFKSDGSLIHQEQTSDWSRWRAEYQFAIIEDKVLITEKGRVQFVIRFVSISSKNVIITIKRKRSVTTNRFEKSYDNR